MTADPPPAAARIVAKATDLFSKRRYEEITVREIAQAAEVNEVTVYRLFGSRDGVAAACWANHLDDLAAAIDDDARLTPVEAIRSHLLRLARVAIEDRTMTNAMMMAVMNAAIVHGSSIGRRDPRRLLPLPDLMGPLIERAQVAGALDDHWPSFDLAAFLTNSILVRIISRPEETAEEVTALVGAAGLEGLIPR